MSRISWTTGVRSCATLLVGAGAAGILLTTTIGAQQQPPAPVPQQPTEVQTTISGDQGSAPRLAVPDCLALSNDAETVDAAKTIGRVLWDDLDFEREFSLIPRDVVTTVPAATSMLDVPFDRWHELNVDAVVICTVQKILTGARVEVRLFNVKTRQSAFGKQYDGAVASKRLFAHTISDEIHLQQRGLQGVARTKLTFNSDRSGERMLGTIEARGVKEVFYSDYDGENPHQVTTDRNLILNPTWSPDGQSIVYSSYKWGVPEILVAQIFKGLPPQRLTKDSGQNITPMWSPDGKQIAFSSTRNGNNQIYVMNADGSNERRLTNSRGADVTPTWSPTGTEIAFTSDRTGSSQIWVMSADGLNQRQLTHEAQHADRATWSPAPYNEIAYAAGTGTGSDIKIRELATGKERQLTSSEGSNEGPTFAPNGRHLAFSSTRAGKEEIFTIGIDGKGLRQITTTKMGTNNKPNWSRGPK